MGQAKLRQIGLGKCIYCGSREDLSTEHVLPYGLGGSIILHQASCRPCSAITGKLEQKLLRGHWWPYRKMLGLQTRHPDASNELKQVEIIKQSGEIMIGKMPLESFCAALVFRLDPPSILVGHETHGEPFAKEVFVKMLGPTPTEVIIDGEKTLLSPYDKIKFPVNFSAEDVTRFLAKVAHGYAISKLGFSNFSELYLPRFILGETDGIQTYVGGYHSPLVLSVLDGGGHNRMQLRDREEFISVLIQLFIDSGAAPPIYEIVVGKK